MIEILLDDEMEEAFFKVIKTDTYSQFDWINFRHVTLCRCLVEISPQDLFKSRETLHHITFKSMVLFKNVLTCLKNLPNVRSLRFSNAAVDEYKNRDWLEEIQNDNYNDQNQNHKNANANNNNNNEEAEDNDDHDYDSGETPKKKAKQSYEIQNQIHLPQVEQLEIEGSPCLTRDDYFLLDFFTRAVTFGNLESFAFRGKFFGVHRRHNEVQQQYGQIQYDLVIPQFLIKNKSSLKRIDILGSGAKMKLPEIHEPENPHLKVNQDEDDNLSPSSSSSSILRELSTVQVKYLIFSFNPGMNHILNSQNHLEELDICNYNEKLTLQNFTEIFSCVTRNCDFLTKISICPTVINNPLENMTVDMSIFQECHSLHTLRVWLSFLTHDNTWRGVPTLGRVKNIHKIPNSLTHLRIDAESFDQRELNQLADRFSEFHSLQYLFLETSVNTHFNVNLAWVVKLMSMPKISFVDLTHCRSETDMEAIVAYMNSKIPPGYFFFLLDMFFYHKHISEVNGEDEEEEEEEEEEPEPEEYGGSADGDVDVEGVDHPEEEELELEGGEEENEGEGEEDDDS